MQSPVQVIKINRYLIYAYNKKKLNHFFVNYNVATLFIQEKFVFGYIIDTICRFKA